MAVTLVTITGNLETLTGSSPLLGRLWFKLNRPDWNLSGDIFAPEYIEAIADAGGAFSKAMQSTDDFETGATYSAILKYREPLDAKDREYTLGVFALPAGGPYQLGDLLAVPITTPVPADILALCQAYAIAAGNSATASAASAAQADTARDEAVLYGGVHVDALTDLYALTAGQVAVGKYVFVRGVGAWYRRVTSGGMIGPASTVVAVLDFDVMPDDGVYSVMAFGAKGDNVTDDSVAIRRAIQVLNLMFYTGLGTNIFHQTATLDFGNGRYRLNTFANSTDDPIRILCNIKHSGAAIVVTPSYNGIVFIVGKEGAVAGVGQLVMLARYDLPDLYKPTGSAINVGSVGYRMANCNKCFVRFGRVSYFERGVHFGGKGEGFVYCEVYLGNHNYCRVPISLIPEFATTGERGWCNDNLFFAGNVQLFPSIGPNAYHIEIDGTVSTVANNAFFAPGLEGSGAEYLVTFKNAANNTFYAAHHENGAAAIPVTVSGDTFTASSHGLVVGDLLFVYATVLPTGIFDLTAYWVVAVPTANTFKISINMGGTAITAGSSGTAVNVLKQEKVLFDGTTGTCTNNTFHNMFNPFSVGLGMIQTGNALGNGREDRNLKIVSQRVETDTPLVRVQQKGFGTQRPGVAVYENTRDAANEPDLWAVALSPRGVLFKDAATNTMTGRLFSGTAGAPNWQAAATGTVFTLPMALRSTLQTVTALSVAANDRALATFTVTGVATGGTWGVTVTPFSAWPDGIALAWARVSATNTVQVAFHNYTGAPISLTTDFCIMAFMVP